MILLQELVSYGVFYGLVGQVSKRAGFEVRINLEQRKFGQTKLCTCPGVRCWESRGPLLRFPFFFML